MTEITIRPCAAPDLPRVHAIYADAVLHGSASFELDPPDLSEITRRWQVLAQGGYPYLVALRGGAVAGYAYAGPYRPRPAYRGTVENSIYVDARARGQGIARLLLTALIEAAEARGFRQMIAVIGDSANAASIGLHGALGFEHAGVFRSVGWKHGRWLDSVLMQRALGPGDSTPLEDSARDA